MKRRSLYCSLVLCLSLLLCLSSAWGQTVTGSVTGQVTDPSGAVLVGANVTAENVATAVKTTARIRHLAGQLTSDRLSPRRREAKQERDKHKRAIQRPSFT